MRQAVMGGAAAFYRQHIAGPSQLPHCLEIFCPQVVVGARQQRRIRRAENPAHHCLTAGRKGHSLVEKTPQPAWYSSESRHCATRSSAAASPHSLPKARWVTHPVRCIRYTAPRANPSAEESARVSGSSITRSAPQRSAASARTCLRRHGRVRPAVQTDRSSGTGYKRHLPICAAAARTTMHGPL